MANKFASCINQLTKYANLVFGAHESCQRAFVLPINLESLVLVPTFHFGKEVLPNHLHETIQLH